MENLAVFWFIFAAIVGVAANGRGRSALGWFLVALLLSPLLAMILLVVMPNRRNGQLVATMGVAPATAFSPILPVLLVGMALLHRVDDWAQVRASNGWIGCVDARSLVSLAAPLPPPPSVPSPAE